MEPRPDHGEKSYKGSRPFGRTQALITGGDSGGATMEKLKALGAQAPLGRPGQPAELASIYVQLAASDASYATGQVYGSTGGGDLP